MAVNINATGSSHPSFKIGATGPTIYQGANPGSVDNGDIWIDSVSGAVKVYQGGTFEIFRFGNIAITGNTISSTTGDVVLAPTGNARVNGQYIVTSVAQGTTLDSTDDITEGGMV